MGDAPGPSGDGVIEVEAVPMPSGGDGRAPEPGTASADAPGLPRRRRAAADALWAVPLLVVLLVGVKLMAFAAVAAVFCLRNPRLVAGVLGGLVALAAGKSARGARPLRRPGTPRPTKRKPSAEGRPPPGGTPPTAPG